MPVIRASMVAYRLEAWVGAGCPTRAALAVLARRARASMLEEARRVERVKAEREERERVAAPAANRHAESVPRRKASARAANACSASGTTTALEECANRTSALLAE